MRILSVCLSVHPSVRVICDKMEESSVQIFIPYERSFSLVSEKKNGWWGDPFFLKFWVSRPRWKEIADFQSMLARSASAETPSEKSSINTIGSLLRAFQ